MPKKSNRGLPVSFRPYTPADNAYLVGLVRDQMKPILDNAMREPYNPEEFLFHVQTSQTRILESNGKPIGFFSYLPLPIEGRLLFSSMILEKDYQGRGIGKKVFEFIEAEAVRLNCPEVECEVQRGNDGALRLYKELGYQEVEIPWENVTRLRKRIEQQAPAGLTVTNNSSEPKTAVAAVTTAKTGAVKSKKTTRKRTPIKKKTSQNGLRTFQR